ncbi:hypothetical protein PTTG_29947 [Puccinia triticina 1-1 BBBD Race 1]|uniref:Uncharacterized protein n=1 Tax=Puccinia triticina (isolate 1-1 / race 1 (BBBD)) TaxID=630390 RepID=A0A180G1A7_PUCT1|nr:hypothetical protein PTTG_29947 [Puccinia triticina 1-1 BBBD Race 1]
MSGINITTRFRARSIPSAGTGVDGPIRHSAAVSPARSAAAPYGGRSPNQVASTPRIHPDLDGAARLAELAPMIHSKDEGRNNGHDEDSAEPKTEPNPTNLGTEHAPEGMTTDQLADDLGLSVIQIERALIRTKTRQKLLMPALHSYGRTHTVTSRALIPNTPLVLVKAEIDAMDNEWKETHLPPGYLAEDDNATISVALLIRKLLKYEKSALAKLIMTGARPGPRANPVAIPQITDVVVSVLRDFSPRHALMTRANVAGSIHISLLVRMAYLRLHMFMQRQQDRTTTVARSPWEVIDRHLESMRRKSHDYKVAYGRLILAYGSQLFDGTKTASDLAAISVALPSEDEVQAILVRRGQEAPDDEDEEGAINTF